jgi:hypothetical protein
MDPSFSTQFNGLEPGTATSTDPTWLSRPGEMVLRQLLYRLPPATSPTTFPATLLAQTTFSVNSTISFPFFYPNSCLHLEFEGEC